MTELNPNSPETRVPALPTPQSPQQLLQALKELIEVREGQRGNPLDQNVTWRELVKSGVARIVVNGQSVGGSDPTFPFRPPGSGDPALDLSPPPQPTGLSASGAIQNVLLSWSDPGLPRIALTEVWRSSTNVAPGVNGSVAVLVGTTEAFLYADNVGLSGASRFYWVRFRTVADVAGPFSASVSGSTGLVGGTDLSDLIVTASKLAADAVEEGKIRDAAITTTKIANLAVGNAAIQNGAITNAKIGNLAVDSAKIADAAIVEAKIADASITNAKIVNAAITDAKIATATITGARIASATITGANIATATITAANIAAATITNAQIANGTIGSAQIGSAAITGANIANATITGANIASATIGGANIASATITGANIANATIGAANIASVNAGTITTGTLDAARIAAGTITGTMIAANSITGANISAGSINGDRISAGTLTANRLAAGTITSNEIAASTIVAGNIAAGTITAGNIQVGTITGDRIAASTITASNMVAGTITAASGIIANAAIGSAQIANTIQSDNWNGSTLGWQINKSGVAAFNEVSVRGQVNTGAYTGYAFPAAGQSGAHLSGSGLLLGNFAGGGRFFQWDNATGQMFIGSGGANRLALDASGNLTITGTLTAAAVNAVDTINLAGNSVTIPTAAVGGGSVTVTVPGCIAGQPIIVIAQINGEMVTSTSGFPPPYSVVGHVRLNNSGGAVVGSVVGAVAFLSDNGSQTQWRYSSATAVCAFTPWSSGSVTLWVGSDWSVPLGASVSAVAFQAKR